LELSRDTQLRSTTLCFSLNEGTNGGARGLIKKRRLS